MTDNALREALETATKTAIADSLEETARVFDQRFPTQPTVNTGLIEPVAYEFDRYINGELMAEGVTIEREKTLADACRVAARIASRGPNGEAPVLVLAVPSLLTKGETDAR